MMEYLSMVIWKHQFTAPHQQEDQTSHTITSPKPPGGSSPTSITSITESHSLHADGAMSLRFNVADMAIIMKQGRWISLIFLTYTPKQISHLSGSHSPVVSTPNPFFNLLAE
jgi:hypothetical protein